MKLFRRAMVFFLVSGASLLPLLEPASAQTTYVQEQEQWRREQEADLRKPSGWLSLAGLYWLKEGRNFVGGAADNDFVFPGAKVSPHIGVIEFHQGSAVFTADPSAVVTWEGADSATVTTMRLDGDDAKLPVVLQSGSLKWVMIKRGERYGIRLRDSASPRLAEFTGMKWFPVQAEYRIEARYTPYESPRTVPITNVLGDVYQMQAPGLLTFKIGRQEFTLEPVLEGEKLFIIFRDLSSGKETYGAGRFLYADMPKNGTAILDFNQAVNPPCAFTPFATCPLPPARNWLKVSIKAGEQTYHHPGNETVPGN